MKAFYATAAALAVAGPACAQDIALKPLVDLRARFETVDQDGLARAANALTFRLRGGLQASSGPLSALVEGQGAVAVINHYYDGLHGAAIRPLIADPNDIALYRAQLQYKTRDVTLTAGRQRIVLDDERFIGAINFRNNGQTFDAVRAEITPLKGLKADVSYIWSVRTIWGIDGVGARQLAISGDTILANLSYAIPVGTLTGFAYLIDEHEAIVQGYRLSNQSYGVRLAGSRPLSKVVKLSYQLSYARQSDYRNNPNNYTADYYLIDAALDARGAKIGGGYEVLGAGHGNAAGVALDSFQTPLATAFKFQGWADKFLTTPPNGVRDLYGSVGYGWKTIGRFKGVSVQAIYHRFDSDRLSQHYGNEIDVLGSAKLGKTTLSVRYADYRTKKFLTDTRKVWLQADWAL
ncbi:alginate export family protein [Flavisphingomonas formosensis]|uniref:alginate export family protein n=1 Tax=Flavisphingomonas formosensis TaxID=861534 RepID=UPI0012FAC97F|nr:alginate export family protein [Sphingomonas formosensis]